MIEKTDANSNDEIIQEKEFLLKNLKNKVPKNINEILAIFEDTNDQGFYMAMTFVEGRCDVENQCLILDPTNLKCLNNLISHVKKLKFLL